MERSASLGPGRTRQAADGVLTGVGTVRHHQQAQRAEVDVPLVPVSDQGPVHVPRLHTGHLGCRERSVEASTRRSRTNDTSEKQRVSTFGLADLLDPGQRVDLHEGVGDADDVQHVHDTLTHTHTHTQQRKDEFAVLIFI